MREYRYEEKAGHWLLTHWGVQTTEGAVGDWPKWLADILAVAVIGGHIAKVPAPPPENILWFDTDESNHLLRFRDV